MGTLDPNAMPDGNPLTAVHFHQTDPGTRFAKDPGVAIDLDTPLDSTRILTPNVVRLPEGGYRMYYTGRGPAHPDPDAIGYVLSAHSDDADTWIKDPGIRIDLHSPRATTRTLCPDVVPLPDGTWRMYYEARSGDAPTTILSAVSDNGLQWETEAGIRIGDGAWSYGTPRLIYLEDGRSRLYFHRYTHPLSYELNAGNHIISAISSNGLEFTMEEGVRIAQETARETFSVYAPEVIRLGDGSYRMYYAAWTRDIPGGIFTATSSDGLTWVKDPEICIELDVPFDIDMISEPCITELPDGRPRLFYEARDREGNCRILSATGGA